MTLKDFAAAQERLSGRYKGGQDGQLARTAPDWHSIPPAAAQTQGQLTAKQTALLPQLVQGGHLILAKPGGSTPAAAAWGNAA